MKAYGALFSVPGGRPIIIAGMLGRFPIAMTPLAIVFVISVTSGSFVDAGLVSAGFTLAGAIVGPQLGRIADRFGQLPVLLTILPLHSVALVAFMLLTDRGLSLVALVALASFAGMTVPALGMYTRARWTAMRTSPQLRHTALSWETISDETSYVVGPALVGAIAATGRAELGLALSLALTVFSTLLLASQRKTEPPLAPRVSKVAVERGRSPLLVPGFALLLLSFLATGGVFGSINVTLVAVSKHLGNEAAGGLLVSLFSVGSLTMGFVYGAIHFKSSPVVRWVIAAGLFVVCSAPLLFAAASIGSVAVAVAIAGCVIAPTMITGHTIVALVVPGVRRTEGFGWMSATTALGITVGSVIAGHFIDGGRPTWGFAVLVGSATTAFLISLLAFRPLARSVSTSPASEHDDGEPHGDRDPLDEFVEHP